MQILAVGLLEEARRRRRCLVADADAPELELLPGGRPGQTFNAIHTRHLPTRQRLAWWAHTRALSALYPQLEQALEVEQAEDLSATAQRLRPRQR